MHRIKVLRLIFDNGEASGWLSPSDYKDIKTGTLKARLARFAEDTVGTLYFTKDFFIELKKDANDAPGSAFADVEDTLFNRIRRKRDLSSVRIIYIDGTEDEIYIKWRCDIDDIANLNQKAELVQKDGEVLLVITIKGKR